MSRKIRIEITLTDTQIRDMLITAFEGGSNYWYCDADWDGCLPPGQDESPDKTPEKIPLWGGYDAPFQGGSISLAVSDPCGALPQWDGEQYTEVKTSEEPGSFKTRERWRVDLAALQRAAQIMAEEHPRHFGAWVEEQWDAETADVFLQLACFGRIIFG